MQHVNFYTGTNSIRSIFQPEHTILYNIFFSHVLVKEETKIGTVSFHNIDQFQNKIPGKSFIKYYE